jgi:hypothetical protein
MKVVIPSSLKLSIAILSFLAPEILQVYIEFCFFLLSISKGVCEALLLPED